MKEGKITKIDGNFVEMDVGEKHFRYEMEDWVRDFVKEGQCSFELTEEGKLKFVTTLTEKSKAVARKSEKSPKEEKETLGQFRSNEIVDIQGKKHVIYEGLLRLAHEKGLQKFEITEKFVSQDMKTAWVQVRAHCTKDKKEVFFDGIGSSTPENTGKMTEHHPVEMAHTRAKGRALRDFLNIGQAMAEEIKQ